MRGAPDGLAEVSTYTIWKVLKEAGFEWQRTRSWCETGKVKRKRKKSGEVVVEVTDPDAEAKKFRSNALTGRARRWASQCGESIKPVHCRRCLIPEVVAASRTVNPSANLISI